MPFAVRAAFTGRHAGYGDKMKKTETTGKKVQASYRVEEGDVIRLFLSEDTITFLTGDPSLTKEKLQRCRHAYETLRGDTGAQIRVVYEDEAILLINNLIN